MTAAAFDTLGTARDLEAAGIARAHAEAIAQAINHGDERAATKADIDALESRIDARIGALKVDIDALESRIDARVDTLESRIDARIDALESRIDARIDTLEKSVDAKLGTLETRVDAKLAGLEARLTNRLHAVVLAAVMANGLIAAALKLL